MDFSFISEKLRFSQKGLTFADPPYRYKVKGSSLFHPAIEEECNDLIQSRTSNNFFFSVSFKKLPLQITQVFKEYADGYQETITLTNTGSYAISFDQVEFGIRLCFDLFSNWRLCAIPFRVQLDGSVHDYTTYELSQAKFKNAVYSEPTRPEPPLVEAGILRSEAWALYDQGQGVLIFKYNPVDIELCVVKPDSIDGQLALTMGGAGFCLYGEPSAGRYLLPGKEFSFGLTYYLPFEGGLNQAFYRYRNFIDEQGHGYPCDYNPPVHWNELYDIGWYHSDAERLSQNYTRAALLKEAEKASLCHCEQLYLDPGWEIAEGTTLWDENRLGPVHDLVKTLREDYNLGLAFRTILRCYRDHWDEKYLVLHADGRRGPVQWTDQTLYELCLCNPEFWKEKLNRILTIARQGVRFIMIDEMDWRGACFDPTHGHPVPTNPIDHVMAVYQLSAAIRKECPGLITEVHDPIWPWSNSIYVPTYFKQGFGEKGYYDENWGFEYMWNCIDDLQSGKALALYYYNMGSNVPLYLHITMAADNDQCIFFWWAASTVRHLGIGGKTSHYTVEPAGGLPPYDPEKRFKAYQREMAIYRRLKPFFVRGIFQGLAENIHLHTLPEKPGGVIVLFNFHQSTQEIQFSIPRAALKAEEDLPVCGASANWNEEQVNLSCELTGMSPKVVEIGKFES